jgi:hypothetical protein
MKENDMNGSLNCVTKFPPWVAIYPVFPMALLPHEGQQGETCEAGIGMKIAIKVIL